MAAKRKAKSKTPARKRRRKQVSPSITKELIKAAAVVAIDKERQERFDQLIRRFETLADEFQSLKRSHESFKNTLDRLLPDTRHKTSGDLKSSAGTWAERGEFPFRPHGGFGTKKK
jgi:hypothetical protein